MIVNSQPYNTSQQSQQQRCIGIGQATANKNQLMSGSRLTQATATSGQQQQNSLYGSNLTNMPIAAINQRSSHMFDLANLQQQQNSNLFDSAYDDATSSLAAAATANTTTNTTTNQSSDQISHTNNINNNHDTMNPRTTKQMTNSNNKQHQMNDVSLYSPSSSTSLLYHVYDQINVPNDHQVNGQSNNNNNFKRSNTTTILNPANLFGQTTVSNNHLQHQQLTMPHHHQHQPQQQQHLTAGPPSSYTTNKTTIPQQELYSSGTQFHLQHQHNSTYYGIDNHQMMLDTILRQQHAAANVSRTSQQQQQQQHYHNRPLSSSGASSMSGQSMALTYGRQPRQANSHLPPLPPINSSKSQNTLAVVLQSNQTLNHLGLSLNGHLTPSTIDTRGPKKLSHHQFPTASSSSSSAVGGAGLGRKWKRAQHRVRNFAYEYSTLLKCSMLLILLAFSLMSIIKFTLLNDPSSATTPINSQNQMFLFNQHNAAHQHPQQQHSISSSSHTSNSIAQGNMNPLIYPPTKLTDQSVSTAQSIGDLDQGTGGVGQVTASSTATDMLKSKLLIGEFVITSQNYTSSPAQKTLLAENIVKLMDQVFLSTEVRRVYSRMEVTNIRPHRTSNGIVVDCNIILSDSIAYAAQQFGIALYDSLAKSNEKLANQPSFIIDKSSIRFNTVPDKDLNIVPAELIPPFFPRADMNGAVGQLAPSPGSSIRQPIDDLPAIGGQASTMDNLSGQPTGISDESAVVWSEWSQWSSCVDKNGICDPQRLHSRLRKCVAQHTGEKVDALQCRQRFNMQDQELEVADCSSSCANSMSQQQPQGGGDSSHVMSDAPSVISPLTAPSVMMAGGGQDSAPAFLLSTPIGRGLAGLKSAPQTKPMIEANGGLASSGASGQGDLYTPTSAGVVVSPSTTQPSSSTQTGLVDGSVSSPLSSTQATGLSVPMPQLDQQQMSCSNCTSDEICLLLITQKVPFCAKIKDRQDESGCGGWCKAQSQLCQPVGQNAFKCIHDSECLPDEWRCHDSACIPMSKRCDGHSNCYDNSDERDCPAR